MTSTISKVQTILTDAGYAMGKIGQTTTFEDDVVLGFVFMYPDAAALMERWYDDHTQVLKNAQFALRRSDAKAWNVYFLALADQPANYAEKVTLSAIEENLVGTRKIARAGMIVGDDLREALLPLLPIHNTSQVQAVDMPAEIRLRTTELSTELVEVFLSDAPVDTVLQMLEGKL
ncbi:hypothetical protein ACIPUD_27960 [Bradyrhizobium sp. CAR08]